MVEAAQQNNITQSVHLICVVNMMFYVSIIVVPSEALVCTLEKAVPKAGLKQRG